MEARAGLDACGRGREVKQWMPSGCAGTPGMSRAPVRAPGGSIMSWSRSCGALRPFWCPEILWMVAEFSWMEADWLGGGGSGTWLPQATPWGVERDPDCSAAPSVQHEAGQLL